MNDALNKARVIRITPVPALAVMSAAEIVAVIRQAGRDQRRATKEYYFPAQK